MKVTCPITLASYTVPNIIGCSRQIHPALKLSKRLLQDNMASNATDKPIILLAVLNAFPNLITLEQTDYSVITYSTLNQLDRAYNLLASIRPSSVYPKFRCTTDTVNNLKQYLDSLYESVQERNYKSTLADANKEVTSLRVHSKAFPTALTRWLFNSVQFPNINITGANRRTQSGKPYSTLSEYWRDLFKDLAKDTKNIFTYPRKDFDELQDFLLENLENDCTNALYVFSILSQVEKELVSIRLDHAKLIGTIQTTVSSKRHEELKGTTEPNQSNFITKTDYLIALAKWRVANKENKNAS